MNPQNLTGLKIHIRGIVQGVGFRPFIYNTALKHQLTGWVKNTSSGVFIEVTGTQTNLDAFLHTIQTCPPPLAKIDQIQVENTAPNGCQDFRIIESSSQAGEFIPVSPDIGICDDCLKELLDPKDRRYRYPFINCTNCGPRFTIIQDIPYDRPLTTMSGFEMCPDCQREYNDPNNRRFHAQPIACPVCGPHIWLQMSPGSPMANADQLLSGDLAIYQAQRLFNQGKIVAIKGLGGFHLACNALDASSVNRLRSRKLRVDKPFAVMMPDIDTVEKYCFVNDEEKEALLSKEKPILILRRRPDSPIAHSISPNQETIGVMLPYTPLHHLLFIKSSPTLTEELPDALVMTSGNLSEEPIAFRNQEALERLVDLADAFLLHNRDIHIRCDDSVGRVLEIPDPDFSEPPRSAFVLIRRARGFTPSPLTLPWKSIPLLAVGAELKNTFCLARDQYAFVSHFIGDMQNFETYQSFESGVEHFKHIFRISPEIVAYDAHPDYLTTRYAQDFAATHNKPAIRVQHHHAHIAAVMAEYGLHPEEPVIGIALDGTGFGEDGKIWGGEFLVASYYGYQRKYHLEYFPLPGGDFAIKSPARIALAYLWKVGIEWDSALGCVQFFCAEDRVRLESQLKYQINTIDTSSMGRLFDAVASLANIRHAVNYEAQAAIELEAAADDNESECYSYEIAEDIVRLNPLLLQVVNDVLSGVSTSRISSRFHNTITKIIVDAADHISRQTGIKVVILSGGVWQNMRLLRTCSQALKRVGFNVLFPCLLPANDGGISFGQAAIAHHIYQTMTQQTDK